MAFKNTLQYTSPSHGDWGIVRIASLVPESFSLFVCPFACGRHGALGALAQGFKDRLAYVYITQNDIINGYDEKIEMGVAELLRRLKVRPRAMFIYVSCLDELIGTDMEAIVLKLRKTHPDVDFNFGRMNPIAADTKAPPGILTQAAMYGLLKQEKRQENQVNLLGVLEGIPIESELFLILKNWGFDSVKQISDMTSYDEFQSMGNSAYNIVVSPIATLGAKNMKKEFGTEFCVSLVSYDTDIIEDEYKKLAAFFGKSECDFSQYETKQSIKRALEVLGDTPIVVGQGSVLKPFELARALIKYGFNVCAVAASEVIKLDKGAFEDIKDKVRLIHATHPDIIQFKDRMEDAIAVGFEAAYITGSSHIANVTADQGMYGYNGVEKLMDMLIYAKETEQDLKELIDEYGVVI